MTLTKLTDAEINAIVDDAYVPDHLGTIGAFVDGRRILTRPGPLGEETRAGQILSHMLTTWSPTPWVLVAVVHHATTATPDETQAARRIYEAADIIGVDLKLIVLVSLSDRRLIVIDRLGTKHTD